MGFVVGREKGQWMKYLVFWKQEWRKGNSSEYLAWEQKWGEEKNLSYSYAPAKREVWISAEWSKCFLEDKLSGIHMLRNL